MLDILNEEEKKTFTSQYWLWWSMSLELRWEINKI